MLRTLAVAVFLISISAPLLAASPPAPFEQAAFVRAQAEGRTIIVESHASWCLPCRIQAPIIERLRAERAYAAVLVFRIGEKTPPPVWKRFRLTGYGALVVFKGEREVGRGTPTSEAAVAQLLRQAL